MHTVHLHCQSFVPFGDARAPLLAGAIQNLDVCRVRTAETSRSRWCTDRSQRAGISLMVLHEVLRTPEWRAALNLSPH